MESMEIMVEKEEDQKEKALEMTIEELELSVRSFNCLKLQQSIRLRSLLIDRKMI